jgi:hypothetical protein
MERLLPIVIRLVEHAPQDTVFYPFPAAPFGGCSGSVVRLL